MTRPPSKHTKSPLDKKGTATAEAIGRSRGEVTTKVYAVVDALGNGLRLALPPSRKQQRVYDTNRYADRNKASRFFGRLKEARGFATRYEKTATSFLAVAHLLAALDWRG